MARKKPQTRAKRGTVSIVNRDGMLYLRFKREGKDYRLAVHLADSPYNRLAAQKLATQIETEMAAGIFDPTLDRYRPAKKTETIDTVTLFERFIIYRQRQGTSGQAISTRYRPLLANLRRFERSISTEQDARDFMEVLRSRQSPTISNQNLSLLRGFCDWAIQAGHIDTNPFTAIKPVKATKNRRQPFSREEISKILATAKFHRTYSSYHDFILILLSLGLRPSEAIGLRWQHIDLMRKQVTITESLSRSADGRSSGTARQRKATKTTSQTVLPLTDRLCTMLAGRRPLECKPDDLVFTSAKGLAIDDHSFSQRVWKRILQDAGVEHRPPYNSRHSFTSHLIESGASLPQVAAMLGHRSTRMVAETYGHMLDRPTMPEF
jgi:integrase